MQVNETLRDRMTDAQLIKEKRERRKEQTTNYFSAYLFDDT